MALLIPSTSVADPSAAPEAPDPQPRGWLRLTLRAVAFLAVFMALQALWEAARGSAVERFWVETLTVGGAVQLIQLITPDAQALAQGSRIVAPGGGLNVLFGCEGTDVLFLLAAGLSVFSLPWRWRLGGLAMALLVAYAMNLVRIVGLFYAFRHDASLFDLLHTAGAPLAVVACSGLFFHAWLGAAQRTRVA